MTNSFSYSTTFVLDKAHFNECFSNSVVIDHSWLAFRKAIIFLLIGIVLVLFINLNAYVGYFLLGLGCVEALSLKYQQPWWVTRQMLSRVAGSEVTLILDETGIHTHSFYLDTHILWQDIKEVNQTKDGFLVVHIKGHSYVSDTCLSEDAKAFLSSKLG
jgi:hypothetical protein